MAALTAVLPVRFAMIASKIVVFVIFCIPAFSDFLFQPIAKHKDIRIALLSLYALVFAHSAMVHYAVSR